MRTGYLGDSAGTTGTTAGDFFPLQIKYLKVTKRYPASGLPSPGVSMSLDIELQTARNVGYLLRYPLSGITCANVIVVAGTLDGQVLGSVQVNTSFLSDCTGTAHLVLDPSFRPSKSTYIQLKVYEDTVDVSKISSYTPLYELSVPIGVDYQTGLTSGVYQKQTTTSLLPGLNINLKTVTTFLLVGAGVYLVIANRGAIKELINGVAK